jgi:recombination protein RecA
MKSTEEVADLMKDTANADALDGLKEVTDWFSTGCTPMDLAMADNLPGGAPVGRVVQLFGGASTGKSVLAETIMGYALRSGKKVFLCDVEYTFDSVFARKYGLDSSHENFYWGYSFMKEKQSSQQPESIEEFFDVYLAEILKLRSRVPMVVVLDTLTALPSADELAGKIDEQGYRTSRARAISDGLRKYLALMNQRDVTLIVLDQTRDNVGGFGAAEVTNGGRGMEFYSSVRVHLKKGPQIKNSKDKVIGIWAKFQVIKNKTAPPFRSGHYRIIFDYGMDDITSNLSWLATTFQSEKEDCFKKTFQVPIIACPKCHKLHAFPDKAKKVKGGDKVEGECTDHEAPVKLEVVSKRIMDWTPHIEKLNLEEDLRQVVAQAWEKVHFTEQRKERQW